MVCTCPSAITELMTELAEIVKLFNVCANPERRSNQGVVYTWVGLFRSEPHVQMAMEDGEARKRVQGMWQHPREQGLHDLSGGWGLYAGMVGKNS